MNIFGFLKGIFEPASKLVDNLHTSDEERLQLKGALLQVETGIVSHVLELEKQTMKSKEAIIVAETKSDSWLTRSTRPIVVLWCLCLVSAWWLGFVDHPKLTEEIVSRMFSVVQIGVGGYIGSRGAEKIVPKVMEALKKKEEV